MGVTIGDDAAEISKSYRCQRIGYLIPGCCGQLLDLWITANGFEMNVKINIIFLKLIKFVNMFLEEYFIFDQ